MHHTQNTIQEDARLQELVEELGTQWVDVAAALGGTRGAGECHARYISLLIKHRTHTQHTTYHAPYTLYHTPYTIHHTLYTIYNTSYTMHHTPDGTS
ncbi:hypothetical protein EON63_12355 [archaeon]|nr:MAG: hypothetical protein EON63_12355 [archaeon]